MQCPDCNHNEHEPGKCPKDNCGQSEIKHPSSPLAQYFEARDHEGRGIRNGKRVMPARPVV